MGEFIINFDLKYESDEEEREERANMEVTPNIATRAVKLTLQELDSIEKSRHEGNTVKQTSWAVKCFTSWLQERNYLYTNWVSSILETLNSSSLLLGSCPHSSGNSSGKAKHTSVVFLKTHKTGSSTVQNILFRFAERHNLTVAMPVSKCHHMFCYPFPFRAQFVHKNTVPPDVLTNHARLDVAEMRRLMPKDTRFFTILREPVAMFESAFSYFRSECKSFQRVPNGSIEEFLRQPQLYYRSKELDSMYARNIATFDLGGDKDRPLGDMHYFWRFTRHLEDVFSLVMIMEHFDESLVLLRRLLNWDPEDLVYLKQNMRADESRKRLQGTLPAKIRTWNWLDAALYDYFNASLWRQLEQLGPACLEHELRLLHEAEDRVMLTCFGTAKPQMKAAGQIRNKELKPWQPKGKLSIVGYELPSKNQTLQRAKKGIKDFCIKMIMPELQYSELLFRTQPLPKRKGRHRV
ncbi:galactose-3-O-sulfotransferase 3-like [Engraulis encrasicolus]|uniref:galactose-3-O-sulfotransferase 3-like n=1 Tax=Engraulis encrasicolus TaxID=184585 RepID=UPI002FCFB863